MIWMSDYEGRSESLPKGFAMEHIHNLGRVQGIIIKHTDVVQARFEEKK